MPYADPGPLDQPPSASVQLPPEVRETLSWLAHLLDATGPLRAAEDEHSFARRHLGASAADLVAVREVLGPFATPIVARAFGQDLGRHRPTAIGGLGSDRSPTWSRLCLDGEIESVPCELVAAFAAGTLAAPPLVVSIDTDSYRRELVVHARHGDVRAAELYLRALLDRARGAENFLRGRCVQVSETDDGLVARHVPTPDATRSALLLPDGVWAEIDHNVRVLSDRHRLLVELGLGTNRGLLIYGPPGTGKSALCRVLAAELAGAATVVFCDANTVIGSLADVYSELVSLAPALVVLEDLDLIIGRRGHGGEQRLHGFLGALDGAMSRHHDVVTVATTNDVAALDEAAVRAARFDRFVEIPRPDTPRRAAILRHYLGRLAGRIRIETVAAATDGASGADLRELVRRGVLGAGEDVETDGLLALVGDGGWAPRSVGHYL